ncbi:MAG: dihydroorotate dehydrogenase electron transfer subunit [Pirellulales bacterium]|nr:dihydroorotate dehydrogenase electron transfer subunit [Pirellulales bacterium]
MTAATTTHDEGEHRACWYPDGAVQATVEVIDNVRIAEATYRIRFACPEIAGKILPGQFLMVRLAGCNDPLLGRPFALYDLQADVAGRPGWIDVVYLVGGKFTQRLAQYLPGQQIDVWGPLGNGFPPQATEHLVIAAGGIGQTPFLVLAREHLGRQQFGQPPRLVPACRRVTFCYGVRRKSLLAGVADFEALGIDVRIGTDDGSAGRKALVPELLAEVLQEHGHDCRVVCCGPEPMMEAVAHLCVQRGVPCLVSLESPMACGLGICFSCVTRVRDAAGGWDYRRTCVEGPVFDAAVIAW